MLKAWCGLKIMKGMRTLILFVIYFICVMPLTKVYATPIQAKSCSYIDVSSAVSSASRGDTVIIPEGECTWTSPVNTDKAIIIKGAGVGKTIITSGLAVDAHIVRFNPANPSSDANVDFKVTGITFNLGGSSAVFMRTTTTTALNKISIANNEFLQCGLYCIHSVGNFYGVVGGNYFTRPTTATNLDASIMISGHSGSAMWNAIDGSVTGTEKNLFIEDNYFNHGTKPAEKICISSTGASYVFRYNTIQYTTSMYTYGGDTHGCQNGWSYASRGSEFYGNKFILDGIGNFGFFYHRGGRSMFFNNRVIFTRDTGRRVSIHEYSGYADTCATSYACPAGTLYAGSKTCAQDLTPQHTFDTYLWNNRSGYGTTQTLSGTSQDYCYPKDAYPTGKVPCDATGAIPFREDTDFWADASNFNGTSGVGCGTLANRPATCTAGVGYWATTQSCSVVPEGGYGQEPSTIMSGTLYKCTEPNTWTAYYTPYTYPHPLRTGEVEVINAPKGFKVVNR